MHLRGMFRFVMLFAATLPAFVGVPSAAESYVLHTAAILSAKASRVQLEQSLQHAGLVRTGTSADATIDFPDGTTARFSLAAQNIFAPDARIVEMSGGVAHPLSIPSMQFFTGEDPAVPGSYLYLSVDADGRANGFVDYPTGDDWSIATDPQSNETYISAVGNGDFLPDGVSVCGLDGSALPRPHEHALASNLSSAGPRMVRVAIDADSVYTRAFPNNAAAVSYVGQVIGAVTAVYLRDIDVRLVLKQVRVFSSGAPFSADNLSGFANYWNMNEDTSKFDIVHMFSMRRDLSYGGVAFLSGTCSGAFGIDGYLNGNFPLPTPANGRGLWDVIVTAHEMGHNLGTLHTHDGYDPAIDQCGSIGTVEVGTIMSYCHTVHGGEYNLDLRMHRRVEDVILSQVESEGCLSFDCNGNGIPDSADISNGTSIDTNSDGIPDECQDCNGNGILDPIDIANGMPDVNGNLIPDVCEPDCNANQIPDRFEIASGLAQDLDGNDRPDGSCDPHCNGASLPDHQALGTGLVNDINRNRVPDDCASEDCDGNGLPDWLDMQSENFLFACYPGGTSNLISYHDYSGVRVKDITRTMSGDIVAMTITANHRIVLLHTGGLLTRLNTGGGEAAIGSFPHAIDIRAFRNLVVIADSTAGGQLLLVNSANGNTLATVPVKPGLSPEYPQALNKTPTGTLCLVTTQRNILEYAVDTASISFLSVLVPAANAGLMSKPNAITMASPSQILVSSAGNNQILEYNGVTHTATGNFLSIGTVSAVTDLEIAPRGTLVVSFSSTSNINQYDLSLHRSMARYMRGLDAVITPSTTDMEFMPQSDFDCNGNGRPDACDIADGLLHDANHDGYPDECGAPPSCCLGTTGDVACDGGVDIADLTVLVDNLFGSFAPLCCEPAANVDGIGGVDIGDLTVLVDNLFISFAPLAPCGS